MIGVKKIGPWSQVGKLIAAAPQRMQAAFDKALLQEAQFLRNSLAFPTAVVLKENHVEGPPCSPCGAPPMPAPAMLPSHKRPLTRSRSPT